MHALVRGRVVITDEGKHNEKRKEGQIGMLPNLLLTGKVIGEKHVSLAPQVFVRARR